MRKGRFAGLGEAEGEASRPLGLAELLLFDFRTPLSSEGANVAGDRARGVAVSIPFLIGSHLLWIALLIGTFLLERRHLGLLPAPLCAVILADLGLWALLGRASLAPHARLRLAALHSMIAAALVFWALSLVAAGESLAPKAALVAALGAGIAAYFTVPLLLILACAVTVGGLAIANAGG